MWISENVYAPTKILTEEEWPAHVWLGGPCLLEINARCPIEKSKAEFFLDESYRRLVKDPEMVFFPRKSVQTQLWLYIALKLHLFIPILLHFIWHPFWGSGKFSRAQFSSHSITKQKSTDASDPAELRDISILRLVLLSSNRRDDAICFQIHGREGYHLERGLMVKGFERGPMVKGFERRKSLRDASRGWAGSFGYGVTAF